MWEEGHLLHPCILGAVRVSMVVRRETRDLISSSSAGAMPGRKTPPSSPLVPSFCCTELQHLVPPRRETKQCGHSSVFGWSFDMQYMA